IAAPRPPARRPSVAVLWLSQVGLMLALLEADKGTGEGGKRAPSMSSFKTKLVSYFALIAAVPTALAFYGFDTLSKRHELQRVDTRLRADVRFALAGHSQQPDSDERWPSPHPLHVAAA